MKKIFYIIAIAIVILIFLLFVYTDFMSHSPYANSIKSIFIQDEELKKCLQSPNYVFMGSGQPQQDCLFQLALKREDVKICENIIIGDKAACQMNVALKTENISICSGLIELSKKISFPEGKIQYAGKCYYRIALKRNDPSICEKILDDDIRLYCSFHFDTEKATKEIRERVNPESESCIYIDGKPDGDLDLSYNKLMWQECGRYDR